MFGQNSKSVKKRFLAPQPVEGKCPGISDQIFQIAVISEYVSKFCLKSVQWPLRLGVEERKKKERKNTAVKYKPFDITMPCGLIRRPKLNSYAVVRGTITGPKVWKLVRPGQLPNKYSCYQNCLEGPHNASRQHHLVM